MRNPAYGTHRVSRPMRIVVRIFLFPLSSKKGLISIMPPSPLPCWRHHRRRPRFFFPLPPAAIIVVAAAMVAAAGKGGYKAGRLNWDRGVFIMVSGIPCLVARDTWFV